jgi:hypothetical protein
MSSTEKKLMTRSFRILAMAIFSLITGFAQPVKLPARLPIPDVSDSLKSQYATLIKEFGKDKEIPAGYEKQVLYALSYFPELKHTKIRFKIKKGGRGIIATRPTIGSLLRRSSKRTYIVVIADSTNRSSFPAFSKSDVNGQVGILGHEFCHIVYFNNSTGVDLLGLAVSHISRRYMDRFEYKTDSMDIERGLGYQLIAWNEYLQKGFKAMYPNGALPPGLTVASKRYMSIERIKKQMAKSKS